MVESRLTKMYQEMESLHLRPLWLERETVIPSSPVPKMVPWLWKWSQLYDVARLAGSLIPVDRGGDRRVLALSNPGLGAVPYATPTLWVAVQWLNGREVAPAHRHSAQAVRFMLKGRGAYTTVQGDKIYLEPGDFAINPPMYWHDHGSEADEPAVWMDGLDVPLTNYLDASFFEVSSKDTQDVTAIVNGSVMKYGVGQLRPAWETPCTEYSPISTYKWETTERALNNLARVASSPFDDVAFEYTNPHTGRPVMDTMTAWVQMLRPGVHTRAHRQVNTAVYHAFEGRGATIIDGVRFEWEQGDMFAIPSWTYHEHLNASSSERAILFSLQDTPVLKALGKYREEAYALNDGHQPVKAAFSVETATVRT